MRICWGLSIATIADSAELGIAEITVKVERSHLRRKLHAESVIDLVKMVEKVDTGSP